MKWLYTASCAVSLENVNYFLSRGLPFNHPRFPLERNIWSFHRSDPIPTHVAVFFPPVARSSTLLRMFRSHQRRLPRFSRFITVFHFILFRRKAIDESTTGNMFRNRYNAIVQQKTLVRLIVVDWDLWYLSNDVGWFVSMMVVFSRSNLANSGPWEKYPFAFFTLHERIDVPIHFSTVERKFFFFKSITLEESIQLQTRNRHKFSRKWRVWVFWNGSACYERNEYRTTAPVSVNRK